MKPMFKCILFICMLVSGNLFAQNDSLSFYLELAAKNNPQLRSEFSIYQASLQKIPQAGAIADPQLEMGFFLQPMEIIDGKQVADFKLMQMFPWFGTRKAARKEAEEMARMSFEKFRETRNKLYFDVKSTWYLLNNLQQQLHTIRENKVLLNVLSELATSRFLAPVSRNTGAKTGAEGNVSFSGNSQVSSGGMPAMGSMGGVSPITEIGSQPQQMRQMSGSSDMSSSSGGMSGVLQVQLELNELDDSELALISEITAVVARFNVLLNRESATDVTISQTIVQREFTLDDTTIMTLIRQQNPMLRMATAESEAYQAKLSMDKKMGFPMIGVGLQYSVISKRMDMGIPVTSMNGKDMIMPMVSFSIPLYRKKYSARQKESRLMQQAAEEKYEGALNTLSLEYVSIRQQLADADRKVKLYERQSELARTTYQVAVKEFSAGINSMTNVLEIHRQLLEYQLKRSEAITTYNTVVAMIENLLSEPFTN